MNGTSSKKNFLNKKARSNIFVITALAIPVVHFVIFWILVNFNSILMAFQRFDTATGKEYFTLANFADFPVVFNKFGKALEGLKNTALTWAFQLFFLQPWGFLLTFFIYKKIPMSGVWRTYLFIPALLPAVAMTSIFSYITLSSAPVGQFITQVTGTPHMLLTDPKYANTTVIVYVFLTNFGGQFVLFSGAMGRIPKELIESAQLDGATLKTELFKIVLPLCWSTISMIILLNVAGFFAVGGPVLLLTQGESGTYTMAYYFFAETKNNALYQPAAVGIMFTLILFPIVVTARWGLGKVYADVEF